MRMKENTSCTRLHLIKLKAAAIEERLFFLDQNQCSRKRLNGASKKRDERESPVRGNAS